MKRTWAFLSALLLLAAPAAVQAQFDYTVNANNTITITGYSGPGGVVSIPASITGLPVSSIAENAFNGCTSLTSVTIPGSVNSIVGGAFIDCNSLTAILVDSTNAFYSSLNGVLFDKSQSTLIECPGGIAGGYTVPSSVTSIGGNAFYGCASLTSVTISVGVTNIGYDAFVYCTSLASVTIPGSVTSIAEDAFQDCTLLTSVSIGNGVTSIGEQAFYGCRSLGSIMIPGSVTSIGEQAFDYCTSLTNVTMYNGLASIGEYAFELCTGLTNVTIPGSVISIEGCAFFYCTNLTGVFFQGNAPGVGLNVFIGDNATVYYLPSTSGWSSPFANRQALLWNALIQTSGTSFGVQSNQFGFNITGTPYIPIVVEGCTNLASPVWTPLQTFTITSGVVYFSEPLQTNSFGRYYRISSP
jgi:hypothetical protein